MKHPMSLESDCSPLLNLAQSICSSSLLQRKENRGRTWGLVMSPWALQNEQSSLFFLSVCVHSWEGASYGIRLFAEPCNNHFGSAGKPVGSGGRALLGGGRTVTCRLWSGAPLSQATELFQNLLVSAWSGDRSCGPCHPIPALGNSFDFFFFLVLHLKISGETREAELSLRL